MGGDIQLMQTQLLCTFSSQKRLRKTVDTIVDTYDIIFNKIFVLEDTSNTFDLMCTYNIDRSADNTIRTYYFTSQKKTD